VVRPVIGVEITADDERHPGVLGLMGTGQQLTHRVLARLALVEPPGVHHQAVHLDQAAGASQFGELHAGAAEREAGLALDGPARQHSHAGQGGLILLGRDAVESAVRQAERARQAGTLAVAALRP
jgi:hypothetical protein